MQKEFGVFPPEGCAYDCYGWGTYPGDYYWLPATAAFLSALILIGWAWWSPQMPSPLQGRGLGEGHA